jgi:hypothetical protein
MLNEYMVKDQGNAHQLLNEQMAKGLGNAHNAVLNEHMVKDQGNAHQLLNEQMAKGLGNAHNAVLNERRMDNVHISIKQSVDKVHYAFEQSVDKVHYLFDQSVNNVHYFFDQRVDNVHLLNNHEVNDLCNMIHERKTCRLYNDSLLQHRRNHDLLHDLFCGKAQVNDNIVTYSGTFIVTKNSRLIDALISMMKWYVKMVLTLSDYVCIHNNTHICIAARSLLVKLKLQQNLIRRHDFKIYVQSMKNLLPIGNALALLIGLIFLYCQFLKFTPYVKLYRKTWNKILYHAVSLSEVLTIYNILPQRCVDPKQ